MKRPKKGPRPLPRNKARLPSRKGPEPQRAESFLKSFFTGLAVIAVVIVVKTALENTRTGRRIALTSYEFLQFRMASSQPRVDLPVTVLDISGPNGVPGPTLETGIKQTSPSNIEELVTALAECDPLPRGIGIDIDYSPQTYQSEPSAALRHLLDTCLATAAGTKTKKGIPVFVGIAKTVADEPDRWLWEPKYKDLAANILVPKDDEKGVRNMWRWFELEAIGALSWTMSGKLVSQVAEPPWYLAWLNAWALEQFKEVTNSHLKFTAQEFLVDYGPLDQIKDSAFNSGWAQAVRENRDRFSDKFVLIGDVKAPMPGDQFVIPGRRDLIPGVVIHACAVHTLKNSPVFDLSVLGQIAIDLAFAVTVLAATLGIEWVTRRKIGREIDRERVHAVLTWALVICGLLAGVVFVRFTKVMWDDFLFVIAAMLVHSRFEHLLHRFLEWAKEAWMGFLRSFLKPEPK
jgi:hypothetical protein